MDVTVTSEDVRVRFISHQQQFASILGPKPEVKVLCESDTGQSLFHEACIYHHPTRSIFVTSNQLQSEPNTRYGPTSNKEIKLFRIYDGHEPRSSSVEEITFPGIKGAMLNGGVNYESDSILLCAQGSQDDSDISGIISLKIPTQNAPSPQPQTLVPNFHGLPFNSVNDVIVHPLDGSIWFTDPCYGYHQGIRKKPVLPNQVYRFDPSNGSIRAMADGFTRPNGLCFSPDLNTLYVTDTGCIHGSSDVEIDLAAPSHIYAFDVVEYPDIRVKEKQENSGSQRPVCGPFLTNRRTFAFAPGRCPDGIKCDVGGNVFSGCSDGIEVWDRHGCLIGTIEVNGGVANFCFGAEGVLYACNETRLLKVTLDRAVVKGALLGI